MAWSHSLYRRTTPKGLLSWELLNEPCVHSQGRGTIHGIVGTLIPRDAELFVLTVVPFPRAWDHSWFSRATPKSVAQCIVSPNHLQWCGIRTGTVEPLPMVCNHYRYRRTTSSGVEPLSVPSNQLQRCGTTTVPSNHLQWFGSTTGTVEPLGVVLDHYWYRSTTFGHHNTIRHHTHLLVTPLRHHTTPVGHTNDATAN